MDLSFNEITLETNDVTSVGNTCSNTTIIYMQSQDVLPPKGILLSCKMRDFINIVFLPDEVDPLYIFLPIKFV